MIVLDVRGMEDVQRQLRDLAENQIPYALMTAINNTAFAVQKLEKQRMSSVFDRPTPLIQGAFRIEKATKETLTAVVYVDPKRAVILKVHEEGGPRGSQKLERYLRDKGWLANGWRAIATDKIKRNIYGNPSQAEINKIIAGLPSISGTKGDKHRHFVIPQQRGSLSPGIYRTLSKSQGAAIIKLYHFVSRAQYRERLQFAETAEAEARSLLPGEMQKAIERAIATAR